jgi:hypothetical protein
MTVYHEDHRIEIEERGMQPFRLYRSKAYAVDSSRVIYTSEWYSYISAAIAQAKAEIDAQIDTTDHLDFSPDALTVDGYRGIVKQQDKTIRAQQARIAELEANCSKLLDALDEAADLIEELRDFIKGYGGIVPPSSLLDSEVK